MPHASRPELALPRRFHEAGLNCHVNDAIARWLELPTTDEGLAHWLHGLIDAAAEAADTDAVHYQQRDWRVERQTLTGFQRRFSPWLHNTKAWRAWTDARQLHEAAITVVLPLAIVQRSMHSWLISPAPRGRRVLDALHAADASAVATAIGRQVGNLSIAGLLHRGHSLAHLVLDKGWHPAADPVITRASDVRIRLDDHAVVALLVKLAREALAANVRPRCCWRGLRAVLRADPTLWAGRKPRFGQAARDLIAVGLFESSPKR